MNLWFRYPVHEMDSIGILKDIEPDAERPLWQRAAEKRKKNAKSTRDKINSSLEIAYASLSLEGDVTINAMCQYLHHIRSHLDIWLYQRSSA